MIINYQLLPTKPTKPGKLLFNLIYVDVSSKEGDGKINGDIESLKKQIEGIVKEIKDIKVRKDKIILLLRR